MALLFSGASAAVGDGTNGGTLLHAAVAVPEVNGAVVAVLLQSGVAVDGTDPAPSAGGLRLGLVGTYCYTYVYVCMCMYVFMYYTLTHIHTHTHTQTHTQTHTLTHNLTHTHAHTCQGFPSVQLLLPPLPSNGFEADVVVYDRARDLPSLVCVCVGGGV